jgi:phage terminase Nu1 subunit (DNA packaging protein)
MNSLPFANDPPSSRIVRKQTLASLLDVSPRTINNWTAAGVIPVLKIKHVTLFDLDKVMAALERFERKPRR